jgi:hypothetical protein
MNDPADDLVTQAGLPPLLGGAGARVGPDRTESSDAQRALR